MWIGVDDTDSLRGGCTTHVLTEIVAVARAHGLDLIGYPRLVRLNPNIPWKTRGNAALSARFGHGRGPFRVIGEIEGRPVRRFDRGQRPTDREVSSFEEAAWQAVRRLSRTGEPGTDPALVVTSRRPPAPFYRRAVREVVPIEAARRTLAEVGGRARTEGGNDHGLVGSLASIAWPARRRTYELLTYRASGSTDARRRVGVGSVRALERRFPALFLCYDARTRRLMVTPHTPCPILFGLRSRTADAALRARRAVRSERVDRWLLFETNQGTGDHLVHRAADAIPPYTSASVRGRVEGWPAVGPGGHASFEVVDGKGGRLYCVAFEPTKTLPRVVRSLGPGDTVRVWGSRREDPTLRLEGIEILRWNPRRGVPRPPLCPACRRRAGSMGRARGYRCRRCGRRWPPEAGRPPIAGPPLPLGTYHPTPSARRHLAPLGPDGAGVAPSPRRGARPRGRGEGHRSTTPPHSK